MTLIVVLNLFIEVVPIVLLAGIAWYAHKLVELKKKEWISNEYMRGEAESLNRKLVEIHDFLKLTFNKDFAAKVEDIIKIKESTPATTKRMCDDGQYHEVAIDHGW
jgi:hypothetical protein